MNPGSPCKASAAAECLAEGRCQGPITVASGKPASRRALPGRAAVAASAKGPAKTVTRCHCRPAAARARRRSPSLSAALRPCRHSRRRQSCQPPRSTRPSQLRRIRSPSARSPPFAARRTLGTGCTRPLRPPAPVCPDGGSPHSGCTLTRHARNPKRPSPPVPARTKAQPRLSTYCCPDNPAGGNSAGCSGSRARAGRSDKDAGRKTREGPKSRITWSRTSGPRHRQGPARYSRGRSDGCRPPP